MIDERFSTDSFAKLGLNTEESRQLSDLLEQEVNKEMQEVVETKFEEIITRLNFMGHNLKLEQKKTVGEIAFRDDDYSNEDYKCKLRLAFDYVTSSGYADTINAEDM